MENLNSLFLERMQKLLKNDYGKFLKSLDDNPISAVRVNSLLCETGQIINEFPNFLVPLKFYNSGFKITASKVSLSGHPLHMAGAYYIQEPSAMVAPLILNPNEGERVLDLCAAPGGKSTQMAAMMNNRGVLVLNEQNKKRVKTLISNIERMGVKNAVIYSKRPDRLSRDFKDFFDKILVDAPCSGEGMFRKNKNALKDWSVSYSNGCANRQLSILESAAEMCAKDGVIVYSTCTFSKEENEEVIEKFLKRHSEFELLNAQIDFGRECEILNQKYGRRVFPFDGGEGMFAAKLKKIDGCRKVVKELKDKIKEGYFKEFINKTFDKKFDNVFEKCGRYFILPDKMPVMPEGYARIGVYAGKVVKRRFLPSHHLFKCKFGFKDSQTIDLDSKSLTTVDFLHGNVIETDKSGFCCVKVDGIPLGFGNAKEGKLKNFYPKGLRI